MAQIMPLKVVQYSKLYSLFTTEKTSFFRNYEQTAELMFPTAYLLALLTKKLKYGIIISMSKRWICARFAFRTVLYAPTTVNGIFKPYCAIYY